LFGSVLIGISPIGPIGPIKVSTILLRGDGRSQ